MRIIKTKNYDEKSKVAANIIAAQITLKPDSVMGFATYINTDVKWVHKITFFRS